MKKEDVKRDEMEIVTKTGVKSSTMEIKRFYSLLTKIKTFLTINFHKNLHTHHQV